MSNILITGVAGLVGSNLAKSLDQNIIGVDNFIGGYRDNVPNNVTLIDKDCMDIGKADLYNIDTVIHAACTAHEGLSIFSPNFIARNTFGISMNMLTQAIESGVKKFVFMSSMARYGSQNKLPFTEDMTPSPQDPYAVSKVAFEQSLKILSEVHGIEYTIIVPHNIIGPGQVYTDPFRNVAAIMINRMLQGKQPIIYGDGNQMRCFSDIREVVEPIKKILNSSSCNGEVINIGPDSNFVTINDLAEIISNILNFKLNPIYMPDRPKEVKFANCSADKARDLLGYSTSIPLEDTIKNMIKWVEGRGTAKFNYNLPIEITNDKTPKSWSNELFNL
jgi:UDP-glucose 4-epimerase